MPKERESIKYIESKEIAMKEGRLDGRKLKRKSVEDDKAYNITAGDVGDNSITKIKMADDAIGKNELDFETATLVFGADDTSKTATITINSIVIGFYVSAVTGTPAFADLKLSISGTTLTGTRAAAPGTSNAITYTIILLKV